MLKKLAKIKYLPNNFKIIENGIMSMRNFGQKISLEKLNYLNVILKKLTFL